MWHVCPYPRLTVHYPYSLLGQDIRCINTHNRTISEANSDFGGDSLPAKKGLSNCLLRARIGGKHVRQGPDI